MKNQDVTPCRVLTGWPAAATRWIVAGLFSAAVAFPQTYVFEPIPPPTQPQSTIVGLNTTTGILHAKATPDEWFCDEGGSGLSLGQVDANGLDVQVPWDLYLNPNPNDRCLPGGEFAGGLRIPKVNQGYVWGAALVGNQIFFGTTANGQCLTAGQVSGGDPYNAGPWTCQFADSPYSPIPLPAQIGDNRPPRFYVYNIATQTVTDITPKVAASAPPAACGTYTSADPYCLDPLWFTTRGIRAVTSYTETAGQGAGHTYILVSGPALTSGSNKINYFAYDATANQWVAEGQITGYNDQRHWVTDSNGVMYAPMGKAGTAGGSLMRYYGNFQVIPAPPIPSGANSYGQIPTCGGNLVTGPPPAGSYACFDFADVGDLDGVGTDAAIQEGRIIVATWTPPGVNPAPGTCTPAGCLALNSNNVLVPYPYAGLWMSPAIPAGGLTAANAGPSGGWTKVWNALMYDPDPVVATSYDTGALASYNGVLYWGTMNAPLTSAGRLFVYYGAPTELSVGETMAEYTVRPAVVFNGQGFSTGTPTINVLYGESQLYVFTPGADTNSGTFALENNNMGGVLPLYGSAGLNNAFTAYIWSMGIWNGRLYVGTFNWSFLAATVIPEYAAPTPLPNINELIPPSTYGAFLYYFPSTSSKALPESENGVGNYLNYGVRNIIPYTYPNGSISMFLGMANAMNLATTGSGPFGGWELIELTPASTVTRR